MPEAAGPKAALDRQEKAGVRRLKKTVMLLIFELYCAAKRDLGVLVLGALPNTVKISVNGYEKSVDTRETKMYNQSLKSL